LWAAFARQFEDVHGGHAVRQGNSWNVLDFVPRSEQPAAAWRRREPGDKTATMPDFDHVMVEIGHPWRTKTRAKSLAVAVAARQHDVRLS
jgi:hypothetical protein